MADRIESLLSLAGLGSDRDATTTSTSLARSTSAALASVSSRTSISAVTSLPAISTSTTLGRSTIGPVQATTVRSTSSVITTTVARSTSSVISTTSARSTTSVRSTSASSSSARSVSVTTLTSTSSVMPSSTSSSSSSIIRTSSDSVGVPPASATASAGAEDGFKMSGGIIAAIVIASLLALLALLLVGYRYYRRRSRANSRRISGLSAWAGQRQSQAGGGGWDSGEDRWGKQEEGVGKWEGGEKERVSPFPINAGGQPSLGYEQGYEQPANGYPHAGYPPAQPQYAPQQAYDNYNAPQAYHQAPSAVPYHEINKNLPLPPQPVGMGQPETQLGWMPGTPHTFGSFASNDGVNPSSVSHRDDPLAAARATGLHDGAEVVVKQGFIRSLDDELVITVGEKLVLVQAYDDGWSLCEKVNAGHAGMIERGVVPLNCLEAFSGASVAEESVSMPQPAVVGHIGKPEMEQLDGKSSPTKSPAGQEFLAMPSPSKAGKMTRSSTAQSLAVSERSERRSSLFINAAAAGLWLQTQPAGAARP